VPESLRESRVNPARRGALLLAAVAVLAAVIAAVGLWRDRPEPVPVPGVSLAQVTDLSTAGAVKAAGGQVSGSTGKTLSAAAPKSSAIAPRPSLPLGPAGAVGAVGTGSPPLADTTGTIVVSVTGAVHKPGLVNLANGSRVNDAIASAGGVSADANLTGLNLAQKLADGESVVVADKSATVQSKSSVDSGNSVRAGPPPAGSGEKLNLNTADVVALDALPGVGPATAASIVAWRVKNGKFHSVEQLQEISGIGSAKYAALAQLVTV